MGELSWTLKFNISTQRPHLTNCGLLEKLALTDVD